MADEDNVGPAYMFNRNFRSYNRQNHNHWMVKEMCGYLLHPDIAKPVDNARIADIEAGTGIWLFETAATVPKTVRLDGFDASSINYPPTPWWPENVRLKTHDVFQPFSGEYYSEYDIIHAGFPLRLIDDEDANALLTNLTSLLKPGGHLQLFVPDVTTTQTFTNSSTSLKASVNHLTPLFKMSRMNPSYKWLTDATQYFESHGLAMVAENTYSMQDHLKIMWTQNNLITDASELSQAPTISNTGLGQAMANAFGGPGEDIHDTPSIEIPWICFVARKTR